MVRDGVLYHLQEFLLGICAFDGEAVEKLDHQAGKALECSRNADGGRDLNQNTLGGLDVDLKAPSLVDR